MDTTRLSDPPPPYASCIPQPSYVLSAPSQNEMPPSQKPSEQQAIVQPVVVMQPTRAVPDGDSNTDCGNPHICACGNCGSSSTVPQNYCANCGNRVT
ncbi:hypothetical protein Bhyg_00931, partial [Pseudolycoriella hygida]